MKNQEMLSELNSLIEEAFELALQIDQNMAAYVLSIASLEVSERMKETTAASVGGRGEYCAH
jgi:hypothetical protein